MPAPCFRYTDAAAGMAGRSSFATSHSADSVGQVDAADVELAPPLPVGFACAEYAEARAVNWAFGCTEEPEMVTRP